jgi:hypothetical protein
MSSYSPYRIGLRIGKDIVIANQHYKEWDDADKERKKMLKSPTMRAQDIDDDIGVVVMHWKTAKRLFDNGTAVTMHTLEANERLFGRAVAERSPLFGIATQVGSLL